MSLIGLRDKVSAVRDLVRKPAGLRSEPRTVPELPWGMELRRRELKEAGEEIWFPLIFSHRESKSVQCFSKMGMVT
jgi:hypothetical protein